MTGIQVQIFTVWKFNVKIIIIHIPTFNGKLELFQGAKIMYILTISTIKNVVLHRNSDQVLIKSSGTKFIFVTYKLNK